MAEAQRTTHGLVLQELAAIECPLRLGRKTTTRRRRRTTTTTTSSGSGGPTHTTGERRHDKPADSNGEGERSEEEANQDESLMDHQGEEEEEESYDYGRLMNRMGGSMEITKLLIEKDPNRPIEFNLVEPSLNDFIRPIAGEWIPTSNILVKIIKRTKTIKNHNPSSHSSPPFSSNPSNLQDIPLKTNRFYKIVPVGVIPTTVRFRSLADYQYTPDLKHPINVLARDMRSLNPEGVLKFGFEPETEDYSSTSKISLFPPPLFSRYLVPQLYHYRQNISAVVTETPEGEKRLINRLRYKSVAPQTITFDDPNVPQGPLSEHLAMKQANDEPIYDRVMSLFEQRPMWTRTAFQNQFNLPHLPFHRLNREILSITCYTFSDGVFRDLVVKFGYDPRINPESRFFQRISLRNLDRKDGTDKFTFKLMKRTVTPKASGQGEPSSSEIRRDHIFDGLELHQSSGAYQLCDITDPLLVSLINSTKGLLPKCHFRTGWYTSNAIEQIRSILKKKFHALSDEHRVIKDVECVDLLEIDVSMDAPDLLKRYTPAQKKVDPRQNSYFGVQPNDDHDKHEDPVNNAPSTDKLVTTTYKSLYPNPLHKYRREKPRPKAKPVDKRVTFLDDDQDVEMDNAEDVREVQVNQEGMDEISKNASILTLEEDDGELTETEIEESDENVEEEDEDEEEEQVENHEDDDLSSSLSELSSSNEDI